MKSYNFLGKYVQSMSDTQKTEYVLKNGIDKEKMRKLQAEVNLVVPSELREFYEFSYGATLNEYRILTIPEIAETRLTMKAVYGEAYRDNIVPFARLIGVGDLVALDTNRSNNDGVLIIDCFHELPPNEWKGICFGLKNWMKEMVKNDFRPYWI